MLTPGALNKVRYYWCSRFHLRPENLTAGVNLIEGDGERAATEIVALGHYCFISCDSSNSSRWHPFSEQKSLSVSQVRSVMLADEVLLGPAVLMYSDEPPESASSDGRTFVSDLSKDYSSWNRFREELGEDEWEAFGLDRDDIQTEHLFAVLEGERIIAAGYIQSWGEILGHLGVATLSDYRGRGLGKAIVRYAKNRALDRQLIPQYRTLETNIFSIRLAQAVGFELVGMSLALIETQNR